MLTLNTNHHALIAQYHLSKANSALGQAIERLSSGKRINSAKDDPAGFAIANRVNNPALKGEACQSHSVLA